MPLFEKKKDLLVNSKYAGMMFHLRENQHLASKVLSKKWGIKPNSLGAIAHATGITQEIKDAFKPDFDKLKERGLYDKFSRDEIFRNHICTPNPLCPGYVSSDAMMSFIRKSPKLEPLSRPKPDSLMFFFDTENENNDPLKHAAIYIRDGLAFDLEPTGGKFRVHKKDNILDAYPKRNGSSLILPKYYKLKD